MLSKHKLLTPEDYATEEPAAVPAPSGESPSNIPPTHTHSIDSDMLSKHKLLTPEDYATEEPAAVPAPSGELISKC